MLCFKKNKINIKMGKESLIIIFFSRNRHIFKLALILGLDICQLS